MKEHAREKLNKSKKERKKKKREEAETPSRSPFAVFFYLG
jgi:hypothetical protein